IKAEVIHVGQRSGQLVTQLVTEVAVFLESVHPVSLDFHVAWQVAVAACSKRTGAWELIFSRWLNQRHPVVTRVHLGGFSGARGNDGGQFNIGIARTTFDLRTIN